MAANVFNLLSPLTSALPRWSPNGKQIVFVASLPGQPPKIYVVSSDGGVAEADSSSGTRAERPRMVPGRKFNHFWRITDRPVGSAAYQRHSHCRLENASGLHYPGNRGISGRPASRPMADTWSEFMWIINASCFSIGRPTRRPSWPKERLLAGPNGLGIPNTFISYVLSQSEYRKSSVSGTYRRSKLEEIESLKDVHQDRSVFGPWDGLSPDDSPLHPARCRHPGDLRPGRGLALNDPQPGIAVSFTSLAICSNSTIVPLGAGTPCAATKSAASPFAVFEG